MKKILAILALAVAGSAFADSVSIERQNVNNVTGADQGTTQVSVKHDFNKMFAGDITFNNTQTDGTNALSTRIEAGVTATAPLIGSVNGYTRVGYGLKYSNTADFGYYSIEPGVSMPIGPFTAKAGVRYRSATNPSVNNDQTHTARASLSYALTKNDSVAVGYDRVRGDNDQKITKVSYTHNF
jgi:hypothetical protein